MRVQFSIADILWATTLVAVGLATFPLLNYLRAFEAQASNPFSEMLAVCCGLIVGFGSPALIGAGIGILFRSKTAGALLGIVAFLVLNCAGVVG